MTYRLQVQEMLNCTLVTVTTIQQHRGRVSHTTKLYTFEGTLDDTGGLVEILGRLQEAMADSL